MESRNIHDEKRFGPTKYPREKNLDPRKTHKKKYWTHKTPMRKNLQTQNTHDKKLRTNKIPTRKGFGPTKAPAEQWHETHETHD